MKVVPFRWRARELWCVLFGHDWFSYGSTKAEDGRTLEEYNECRHCHLENHDRIGYIEAYDDWLKERQRDDTASAAGLER